MYIIFFAATNCNIYLIYLIVTAEANTDDN